MHRFLGALAGALLATALSTAAASAHDPRADRPNRVTNPSGTYLPLVTSPGVRLVDTYPETLGISGEFAKTGDYFSVSSLDSITVDPATGPQRGRIGGGEVIVVDVTDPAKPRVRSCTPGSSDAPGVVTTSTHTLQCVTTSCEFAYTAGDSGRFSIIDLRDLDRPVEIATARSPASAANAIFTTGSGHYWDFDGAGVGCTPARAARPASTSPTRWTRGPSTPRTRAAPPRRGTTSSTTTRCARTRAASRPAPRRASATATCVLVTEEDYFNDGDELVCERAGTFQTWKVPDLDGASFTAGNPGLEPSVGTIEPLDLINPVALGDGLSTPVGGFCSAHWFDYTRAASSRRAASRACG